MNPKSNHASFYLSKLEGKKARRTPVHWAFIYVITAVVMTGCAGSIRGLPATTGSQEILPGAPGYPTTLQIKYLGAGGFLFRRGDDIVMTAPFYSNPGLLRTGLNFPIYSRTKLVDALLPRVDDVSAIIVGHSHYDHLMDVPFIANQRAPKATIFGNNTMSNLLWSAVASSRLKALDCEAGELWEGGKVGVWQPIGEHIRIMALRSEHAPHFVCIKLYSGKVTNGLERLPKRAAGWREGQTLAFIIDFLSPTKQIDYRIFYQDSAVNCPKFGGLPQFLGSDNRPPDVDILCMASFANVANYPEYMATNHRPANVVIGHWEDFFRSPTSPVKVVRMTNGRKFMGRLGSVFPAENTFLPRPGSLLLFRKPVLSN